MVLLGAMTFIRRRLLVVAAALALQLASSVVVVCSTASTPAAPAAGGGTPTMHHLHFYMHDGYSGPHPTAVLIVNGTGAELMPGVRFGDTVVMDDVLTQGPSRGSREVGRAQGFYVTASQRQPAMLLTMTVLLTAGYGDGEYRGSSVVVVGRNEVTAPVRELAVVGGTGRFRMATGYVLWRTATWKGKSAVLELDLFVRA